MRRQVTACFRGTTLVGQSAFLSPSGRRGVQPAVEILSQRSGSRTAADLEFSVLLGRYRAIEPENVAATNLSAVSEISDATRSPALERLGLLGL
jgi:hypothetical protein